MHAQRARIARLIEVGAFGATPADTDTPGPHGLVITGVDRNTPQNGSCVTNWEDVYGAQVRTRAREKKLAELQRVVARKEEAFRQVGR